MPARERGVRLIAFETLGSTNAEALARARAGERGPLWVTAARQTAGRGRRGNAWTSEPGNLYASLLLTDAAPAGASAELVLRGGARRCATRVAAGGAAACIRAQAEMAERSVARRREVRRHPDRGGEAVRQSIAAPPASASIARIIPRGHGLSGDRSGGARRRGERRMTCFSALSRAMVQRLAQWDRGAGFAGDPRRMAAACGRHRRRHRACGFRIANCPAKFETLDRTGRLMLRLPAGKLEAITVGEVSSSPPRAIAVEAHDGERPANCCSRRSAASARSG